MLVVIFIFLLKQDIYCQKSFSLVADINAPGVVGTVVFTQDDRLYPVSIRTELQPASYNNILGWEIRKMPILWDYSDENYCKVSVYQSELIHNLTQRHGLLQGRALYNDEFISVSSLKNSVAGNTLVIIHPIQGPIACATILPESASTTLAKAEFNKVIAGDVYFISYFEKIYKKTLVLGSIYKVDGISVVKDYNWYIGAKSIDSHIFECPNTFGMDKIFNPTYRTTNPTCSQNSSVTCMVGDMSSKHGQISVGVTIDWSTARPFTYKDSYLPLDGVNSIMWRPLYIVDSYTNETVACGIIKPIEEIKYRVELRKSLLYRSHSILGVVYFRQQTPYHSTFTKIIVKETDDMKFDKIKPPVFAIFDLFSIGLDCNTIGNILIDQNGKPKLLLSPSMFEDYNNDSVHHGKIEIGFVTGYTLSGRKSILSKSVAVFESFPQDDTPMFCGQILPIKSDETVALISNFTNTKTIFGYIIMIQYLHTKNMQFSDTVVVIDLENANGFITSQHKLHIHNNPIYDNDSDDIDGPDCKESDGHFNPYNVSTALPMYQSECQADFMKRCEVGDLDGKHGLYDIGRTRKLFIDTNLNLYGVYYDLRRSIVIHGEGKQKTMIGCSQIKKFKVDDF